MSFNRENVCWQSKDGTWSLAFYECYENPDCEDPEWDVTYGDDFEWVSIGHSTSEAAENSWHGANPGGGEMVEWSEHTSKTCERFDSKAQAFLAKRRTPTTNNSRSR